MTFVKALLKISTLLVLLLIPNYFVSLEASKLYPNTSHVNGVRCIEKERQALLKFKDDAVDAYGILSSWSGRDCCQWNGVGCRYSNGEVVSLHLSGNYDAYTPTFLGGKISNHLNELPHLRYLNLSQNDFSGLIPSQLGNLSNLQVLDLSGVGDNTYVSDLNWISSLYSLKILALSHVNLSLAKNHWLQAINTIPSLEMLSMSVNSLDTIPLSLSQTNLTSLSILYLNYNTFNTEPPQWLSNLTSNLLVLTLVGCGFTGPISNMFPSNGDNYYKLEELILVSNNFSGELPDSMEHLTSLRTLDLHNNSISGPLPVSIGKLSKLESLELSDNNMNGNIPKCLRRLAELKSLNLLNNKWEGVLSQDHFEHLLKLKDLMISSSGGGLVLNLSCNWVPPFSLTSIEIQDCDLGPKFPKWLQNQTELQFMILQNVGISDTIPGWLGNSSHTLTMLILSHNQLQGSIPVNIGQMTSSLTYVDLSKNSLTGSIPFSLGNNSYLTILDLSDNHLSGEIHDKWENFIDEINFSSNNLSGKIPSSLFSSAELKLSNNSFSELPIVLNTSSNSLRFLDMGDNKLCGTIPGWIGKIFTGLHSLRMRGNLFSGSISEQFCHLQSLRVLDLSQNNLSGHIPKCLSQLIGYEEAWEILSMDLNLKGNKYTYEYSVLRLVKAIDLSYNNLCGFIPESITTLGDLRYLKLSNNQLTGKIPSRIGDMRSLETLDLSFNHLYGQIPPSISSMTSLNHLNLSYNNLSGPIPSGSQLSTFDKSIYEGNPGLCGSTFSIECKLVNDHYEDNESRSDGKLGLFVSLALGFIFGFWSIFGTLAVKKSWRRAYFGVIDKIIDQIVVVVRVNLNRSHEMMAKEETN